MAASDESGPAEEVPLELMVFSCGICQATIPDIYATQESNQGFHSGLGAENGVVTRLWIADCSHIFCAKHLPGGGAPFHPAGQQPRATCPHCFDSNGDDKPKNLYGIRGFADGDLDTAIPSSWMRCPAIELNGCVDGMEALRFQYVNIARYAQGVTKHWRRAERHQRAMQSAYTKERQQRRETEQQVLVLEARVEKLAKLEAKLQKWEARKPAINHYLAVVTYMSE
ncbi:hypothetical protein BAUCODRAFT_67851 [Baudoinia panamericana UAMH 10762]|uniref:Uncharacterized protein n=1 Tax=Baudoinia panamericana (strain UAMH 10762) TaxID=717646 RepID=M2ND41_BAUPA|nr:uncharacterized protein BAUCODRAFT_67851 [Baudoinia panamericana UAMH 10762]EMC97119.1 hypothetical protein BAUCODRAFT_67851 [Baudoinia panamericana UAMH 10762]